MPERKDLRDRQVRVSPSITAICLDIGAIHNGYRLNAPYRLHLLLRSMDMPGRGQIDLAEVEALLTEKGAPCYIYGKRQLKNILARGEGLFWNRAKARGRVVIRLVSREKLASALGLDLLRGNEVLVPVTKLLGSGRKRQAAVDAELYAAWHAGRKAADKPISRTAISGATGVSKGRQRRYEARSGTRASRNLCVIAEHSDHKLQRARIHYHLPAFELIDYRGQINRHKRGESYVAIMLPNTYQAPKRLGVLKSRRQRAINKNLSAGLRNHGHAGIGQVRIGRVFHDNACSAIDAFGRNQDAPSYWKIQELHTKTGVWGKVNGEC